MKKLLLTKLALLLVMLVGSGSAWAEDVTDELTQSWTGVSSTSYSSWTGKTLTSGAVYAGQSAGGYSSIQLRSNSSNSGVVTTTSGGKVKKITVTWNSNTSDGRTLNVYGKNSAYSAATDLYNSSNQGTLLGTIVYGKSTELTVTGDYEYIGFRSASGAMYLEKVQIVWETSGGSSLNTSDLTLTGSPVSLNFDLYNNSSAQTVSYTTSGTGAITVSGGEGYVMTAIDEAAKTITVTPIAVTPIAQTITVNQAADETYNAGSVTFTATVGDSTPFDGGAITFDATTDKGSNNSGSGSIVKQVVTLSGSSCNLSDGVAYRLYSGSTTTFSTTLGKIVKIEFTMASGYAATLLSTETGSYSEGVWTGNAESVAFSASAQARVTNIVVTVSTKKSIATINGISPMSILTGTNGTFSYDIEFAEGVTSSDYDIAFASSDDNVLLVESNGEYLAGDDEGSVSVTVTVTPKDNTTYETVSGIFNVSVYAPVVFKEFYESFDNCSGIGGNDGAWTNTQNDLKADNDDWTIGSSSSAYMCAKLGSGSRAATATTRKLALDPTDTYVLTFKAAAWPGATTTMTLSSDDAIFNGDKEKEVTMAESRWTSYYLELTNGTASTQINFRSAGRIFFDEVRVMTKAAYDALVTSKTVESFGWATYIPDYAVEFQAGDAYVVTAASLAGGLTLAEVTSVPAKTPVLLKGAGAKTMAISSDASVVAPEANLLMISNGTIADGKFPYVLAKEGAGAAFKQWTGEAEVLNGRVVLLLDEAVSAARSIFMLDGDNTTTGIAQIENEASKMEGSVYNLNGQRVNSPKKGLYIVNGKKVMMK